MILDLQVLRVAMNAVIGDMMAKEETAAEIPEAVIETDKCGFFARTDLAETTILVRDREKGVVRGH